jgi:hypothetical protein
VALGSAYAVGHLKTFSRELTTDQEPAAVLAECLASWSGRLSENNYELRTQSDVGLSYHRKYRSPWLAIPVVAFFPLGLLALLITSEASIVASVAPVDGGGSRLVVNGKAPKNVREAFMTMEI